MIHLAAFMDIETGLGRAFYHDHTLLISEELIWPMISALNNFVGECTGNERGFVNAALEDIKIYLYAPLGENNPLRFVFFTDLFDNNSYLELKGQAIFEILSPFISYRTYNPPSDISSKVQEIVKYTQIFPKESINPILIESISTKFKNLEKAEKLYVADLFIGDIDQGKVFTLVSKEALQEKNSISLFSELLIAFSIDSDIFVKSSLTQKEKKRLENLHINTSEIIEGWFFQQLAKEDSDFWLVGYFFFKEKDEEYLLNILRNTGLEISEEININAVKRPF